jgi:hypothetical protein
MPQQAAAAGTGGGSASSPPQQQQQPPSPPPQQQEEDKWEVNKPVEARSAALTEELNDCAGRFWTWVTCGGPAARIRQLYVNGRLSRCWDEYVRFKNCLAVKLNPDSAVAVLPGPHPLWRIRTRKQAGEFWREQFRHLGAGATTSGGSATIAAAAAGPAAGGAAAAAAAGAAAAAAGGGEGAAAGVVAPASSGRQGSG